MNGRSHWIVTSKVFHILRSISPLFGLYPQRGLVVYESRHTDDLNDLEFVHVRGGVGSGGRDDPHKDERSAIDDEPHYWEDEHIFTAFNHFIDIKKGPGIFDDFDGYSYAKGSASTDEYQGADEAEIDNKFKETLAHAYAHARGIKIDEGLNWWYNDEYVHAPGRKWYRGCSPSTEQYSFYQDKGIYSSISEEAKQRFPLAESTAEENMGIPYSVFMPVDNLARYWFARYKSTNDPRALGPVMHAIQDASIPHHAAGYCGNWHSEYEEMLDSKVRSWFDDPTFIKDIIDLCRSWNRNDPSPPHMLGKDDWDKRPAKNWTVDFLVTWMALNAYRSYATTHDNFKDGFTFDETDAKELTKKATAICVLTLSEVPLWLEPFLNIVMQPKKKREMAWLEAFLNITMK